VQATIDEGLGVTLSARHLLGLISPWACLMALSMTLACAMNVGLTGAANSSGGLLPPQPLPTAGDAPQAGVAGLSVGNDAPSPRGFREASAVLTITVEGPAGSFDVRCVATTERGTFDTVTVRPDQLMDVFHHLCSPQPGGS
jgi:hypothetical protein